jgi:hypothetical protein
MGKLRDLRYELLEHPPYSPDLAPSDFCFFPRVKLFLAGQRFSSNQEAIAAVEGYFCRSYEEPLQGRYIGAGINVLISREITLKNKNNFEITNSFFSLLGRKLFRPPSYILYFHSKYIKEMGRACGAYGGRIEVCTGCWWGSLRERGH